MYKVSTELDNYILGDARHFEAVMSFKNGTVLTEEICSLDRTVQTSGDDLRPGDVLSAALTGTLIGLESSIQGQSFILSFVGIDYGGNSSTYGFLHDYTYEALHKYTYGAMPGTPLPREPIPMGEFVVTDCKKQDDLWTFEAHDKLYASDKPYNSGLRYPAKLSDVEQELCNGLGIEYRTHELSDITLPGKLEDVTYRQMLGYIAALSGSVCMLDRLGGLVYKSFEKTGYVLEPDRTADPEISQTEIVIHSLHCGDYSAERSTGTGRDITFDDPYMTGAYFQSVKSKWLDYRYTPINAEHIMGDPRLDPLDIVTVWGHDIPLMSIALHWDGGIWAELAATASTDTQYTAERTNVKPFTAQVRKEIGEAEAEMKEAIDYIKGAKGGYVITEFNADGQPTATYYTDNLDPEKATNALLMNYRGISGTSKGIHGSFDLAITNDGRINASRILTGVLSAIIIQSQNYNAATKTGSMLNLNNGTFSFGGGKLKYENDKLSLESAEIRGGSFVVETADEADAVINFASGDWEIEVSPLQWVLTNKKDHTKIKAQAGAIYFYDTSGGRERPTAYFGHDLYILYDKSGKEAVTLDSDGHVYANDIFVKPSDIAQDFWSLREYINNHP